MPLDPRIALGVQGPQVEQPDLLKTMLAAGQLREQQQMLGLRDLHAQQLQQQLARQRALADLWREAQAPGGITPAVGTAPPVDFSARTALDMVTTSGERRGGGRVVDSADAAVPQPSTPFSPRGVAGPTPLTAVPGAPLALPGMAPRRPSLERMLAVGGAEALPQIEALQRLDAHQFQQQLAAQQAQVQQQQAARQDQLLKLQQMDKGIDFVSQALTVVNDQRSLDAARQEVSQASPYLGQMLPQTYDQAAIEALLKRLQLAKQRGQSQQAGLTMHYGRDAAGNVVPLRMTQEGMQQPAMPPGVTLLPPTYSVPGATETTILQRPGGAPVSSIPKQVGQAAEEKAAGTEAGKYAGELAPRAMQARNTLRRFDDKQAEAFAKIDKAMQIMDTATFPTTGRIGQALEALGYEPSMDLAAQLRTLKAQVGLDELVDLKARGGTLGAVSDAEGNRVASAVADLEKAQSKESLKAAFATLKSVLQTTKTRLREAYDAEFERQEGRTRLPAPGQGPPARKAISQAEINALAERRGLSAAEVEQRVRAQGYEVTP